MPVGTVKFFKADRGYGFIAPESGGKDIFVHVTALERGGVHDVREGTKLEFEVVTGRDGRAAAENVRLAD